MHDERSIAIDLGGTIEDTWQQKNLWFSKRGYELGSEPLSRTEALDLIGGDEALYVEMINSVYDDKSILGHSLCAGCRDALRIIATDYQICLLSSRSPLQLDATLQWLCTVGIANCITELALIGDREAKLDWCERHRISVLIDDDVRHLNAGLLYTGTTRIHYAPGNCRRIPESSQFSTASSWEEIVSILRVLRARKIEVEHCALAASTSLAQ